jgi:hypothetical protein
MQPAIAFLRIRLLQVFRELKAAGPLYALVLIGGGAAFLWLFYRSQTQQIYIHSWFAGIVLLIFTVHMNRGDHRFIFLTVERTGLVFMAEYATIILVFVILSSVATLELYPFVYLLAAPLISMIKPGHFDNSQVARKVVMIENSNYEWLSGIRKSGLTIAVLWIIGMLLTPVPYASMLVVWFVLLIVSSFYEQHENREMVESFGRTPASFLLYKIKQQLIPFALLILPVMAASLFFFPERWWIWLLFLVFSFINIGVFVTSKYAIWEPGETHRSSSLINSLCMVSFFVPFLLPLPVFVFFRNMSKSVIRLKPLLHVFHQ